MLVCYRPLACRNAISQPETSAQCREACKEGHVGWQREDRGASKTHVIT